MVYKCAFNKVNSYFPMKFQKYSCLVRTESTHANKMWGRDITYMPIFV